MRSEQTIQLPRLKRMPLARGGHVIYPVGADSICTQHQFCAYTGDEVSLCSLCHGRHFTDEHYDMPPGRTAPCLCSRCGELFTARTGFDMHFRPGYRCGNPEKRGLVLVKQKDRNGDIWELWAKPGSYDRDSDAS